eukprot:gene26551-32086_t
MAPSGNSTNSLDLSMLDKVFTCASFDATNPCNKSDRCRYRQALLVFPLLDGWRNDKVPTDLVPAFVEKMASIVQILNAARIAHVDLRPQNVMWRIDGEGQLDCRLSDLEDSMYFGRFIVSSKLAAYVSDCRYPVKRLETQTQVPVDNRANDCFCRPSSAGNLHSELYGEENYTFADYMRFHYQNFEECYL